MSEIYQLNIIKKKARERCQDLSEEEKNKKRQYGRERYKNLPKDEKQRLVEYRKKHYQLWKNKTA